MKTPSSRAFTLIELLVAVVILSVLAALGMGMLGRARVRARDLTCVNNMRNIGIALHAYAADHRQLLPYIQGQYPYNAPITIAAALVGVNGAAGYLPWNGNKKVYLWSEAMLCGSDPNVDLYLKIYYYPGSYEYRQNEEAGDVGRQISLLTRPQSQEGYKRWLLKDRGVLGAAGLQKPFPGGTTRHSTPAGRWEPDRRGYGSYWHEGGTNVLYEDGSVFFRRIDQPVTF